MTTTGTRVRTLRVTVGLAGRHAHSEYAPDRGIRVVHERGGPLDGPNLNGVVATASDRVEQQYGSPDVLARRFVVSGLSGSSLTVSGEEPTGLDEWLLADLSSLREVVRNLSVTVPRTRLGAGEVVPAEELAAKLRARRGALLDVPGTYGSVATKARIAARSAYLALVIDNLDARARQARGTRSRFDETLSELGVDPGVLSASLTVGASTDRPPAHPATAGGPLGVMNASVVTSPAYLTTSGVTHDRLSAVQPGERYHPLVTRNTNLFTLPYGDAADWVVGSLFDSRRTSLRSAARTLRSANRALERRYDPDLTQRRDALRVSVARSLSYIRDELVRALSSTRWLTRAEAVAAVDAGTGRWKTTTARAFAAVNGSLATAVARAARERTVNGSDVQEARLAGRLRVTLVRARGRALARPPQPDVNRSASATRSAAKQVVEAVISQGANATAGAVRRKLGDKLVLPPAGLPIAPVPGYWYVTTNVWTVTVRGEYLRFAVSVPAGPPGREVTYDRQRQVVALDWDDDGEAERLGRSTRLSFGVSTAAVVVVPPGGPGVGDRNGDADERSAGWPYPGNASSQVTTTSVPDE